MLRLLLKYRYEEKAKERLLARRKIMGDCWIWTGARIGQYGTMHYLGENWYVHKLGLKLFKPEEYIAGLLTCHKTICPNKLCFNPNHLYSGTYKDTAQDTQITGTYYSVNKTKEICPRGHRYTVENTWINSKGYRTCRECIRFHANLRVR